MLIQKAKQHNAPGPYRILYRKAALGLVFVLVFAGCTSTDPAYPIPDRGTNKPTSKAEGGQTPSINSIQKNLSAKAGPRRLLRAPDPFTSGLSVVFIPLPWETPLVPVDVGQGDTGTAVTADETRKQFIQAYKNGLLSFIPLAGTLGADRLHLWTNKNRDGTSVSALVQNWKSSYPLPNGWGLPQLLLAMDGTDGSSVYCILPPILDIYSQARGLGNTAALAGYGNPMTNPFLLRDSTGYQIAQRFSHSLIMGTLDAQGRSKGTVVLEPAPSLSANPPSLVGRMQDGTVNKNFVKAWRQALDQMLPGEADGPVSDLNFTTELETPEGGTVTSVAIQSYGMRKWVLVQVPDTNEGVDDQSRPPVLLAPPFIDALVSEGPDVGTQLIQALAVYGLPLSDSYAMPMIYVSHHAALQTVLEQLGQSVNPLGPVLVQRFQRGLWVAVPKAD